LIIFQLHSTRTRSKSDYAGLILSYFVLQNRIAFVCHRRNFSLRNIIIVIYEWDFFSICFLFNSPLVHRQTRIKRIKWKIFNYIQTWHKCNLYTTVARVKMLRYFSVICFSIDGIRRRWDRVHTSKVDLPPTIIIIVIAVAQRITYACTHVCYLDGFISGSLARGIRAMKRRFRGGMEDKSCTRKKIYREIDRECLERRREERK